MRLAQPGDLPAILGIYADARRFMASNGNASQWSGGYPDEELLRYDIEQGRLYAVEQDGAVRGAFVFILGDEPTYAQIWGGSWASSEPYGTIHRIASDGKARGVFARCLEFCLSKCGHLRIDTHANNLVMQHLVEKSGFERRGLVRVEDGTERIAYEMIRQMADSAFRLPTP